jgi:F-type H+-transporting ATPase subunit alpha
VSALDGWLQEAVSRLASLPLGPRLQQVGRVDSVGDGVAMVSGLDDLRAGELIRFAGGAMGFAQTLDETQIGCVLLDDDASLEAGQIAHGTGAVLRVPVGEALLGRVVDPLGRPLDRSGQITTEREDPAERPAPAIIDRDAVSEPLYTGITLIDAMFALGRGQRELIIGDRATGKTAIATDTIIRQRDTDVFSVYVAVGQKSASIRRVIDAVKRYGAPQRCIFVIAAAAAPPGLQWLAPFAGVTIAEFFRDRGQHALVVIDDLTKHAMTHRELSLLMRQPPGREAYPGDIFYLHARLLERAAKLNAGKGGGSLTALPIAETDAGNLAAYIPTNLISITDGQIVTDGKLFHEGQKPAVDIGKSVSRVGGKAQAPALRELAESLRLDYAQFLELELFTRFSATLDARTAAQIEHGRRLRAVLTQGQYAPLPLSLEIAHLLAVAGGVLDKRALAEVPAFKQRLPAVLAARCPEVLAGLDATGTLSDSDRARLATALAAA